MLKRLFILFSLLLVLGDAYAAGVRSGSYSSSRSYSAPSYARSYRAPAPVQQRTIIREYHTNTVHSAPSSGSGMHPLVAGMAGYMAGNAVANMSNHPGQPVQATQPAPPQVVYVNGQPQQAIQQQVDPQQLPQQPVQYQQAQPAPQQPNEDHAWIFWTFCVLVTLFGIGVLIQIVKKNH